LISVATVGAPVSDMRAKLGNDVAMKAFRAGTLPFPDGTIIARLAWKQTTRLALPVTRLLKIETSSSLATRADRQKCDRS
jgi:hypothetical protein